MSSLNLQQLIKTTVATYYLPEGYKFDIQPTLTGGVTERFLFVMVNTYENMYVAREFDFSPYAYGDRNQMVDYIMEIVACLLMELQNPLKCYEVELNYELFRHI